MEENKAGAVAVGRSPLEPKGAPVNGTCEMAADAVPDPLSTIGTGRALPGGSTPRDAPQTAGMHEGPDPSVSGGTGDVANFQDSADLVVRDGSGQVRQDRTVR